ncbi:EAL domain-containing protein [Sulfobacillus harzensis]|uniref:EAL domain-containing protein n=1 Tax=Sulfobacillus harzensis TaxID=2729629 RepID=A0A7Y0Q331_9FIRM|nr:EAL domain-containing protein [Sulfobacillus harzensis]NMP23162.1 EAL domain-containing protein [Sulfobacillus harzensis]
MDEKQLWSALQPIVDTDTGRVVGHEALLRGPQGSSWESPAALFAAAARLGHQVILEANARHLAVQRLPDLPPDQRLFVNIDAMVLDMPAAPGHPAILPHRVVLEISERQPIVDNPALWEQVGMWRESGFAIALDDYGAGFMGLGALLKLRPDLLKLDRVIVQDVDRDPVHRAAVKNMVDLGRDLDITIIAEGVETLTEYWELRASGVRYMQGFLLRKPQRAPVAGPVCLPPFLGVADPLLG